MNQFEYLTLTVGQEHCPCLGCENMSQGDNGEPCRSCERAKCTPRHCYWEGE